VATGKAAYATAKTTGKVAYATGKVAYKAGRKAGGGIAYLSGRRTVKLDRRGNSFYAKVRLNRRYTAQLLVDTGASSTQISRALAERMGLKPDSGRQVRCVLADGSVTHAREVTLKEVRVGGAKVKKVPVVVLESDSAERIDGLLGMSFLGHFNFRIDTEKNLLILRGKH